MSTPLAYKPGNSYTSVMNRLPLHHLHQELGAHFTGLADWEVPTAYKDAGSEYRAAAEGIALIDRSYLGRFLVQGKDGLDLLNRLSSYKVDVLPEGTGAATVLPTNKGRVIDLLHLFATQDGLLMTTSPHTRQTVAEWIDLYTFLEEVSLEDATEQTAMLTLHGPEVEGLLQRLFSADTARLELYGSSKISLDGTEVTLLRTDPLDSPGYDIIVGAADAERIWRALVDSGATPVGEEAYNALRIQAGIPRYGWELSEAVNPWEVNLDRYIHFAKGCYTGQEVILRLYNYNKVQRRLVSLRLPSADAANGAKLQAEEKDAGWVSSTTTHPLTGQAIGLGVVRSAHIKEGAVLQVVDTAGATVGEATVEELPTKEPAASL